MKKVYTIAILLFSTAMLFAADPGSINFTADASFTNLTVKNTAYRWYGGYEGVMIQLEGEFRNNTTEKAWFIVANNEPDRGKQILAIALSALNNGETVAIRTGQATHDNMRCIVYFKFDD